MSRNSSYKREFSFHDKNNKVVNCEVEIYNLNGYDELHVRVDDYQRDIEYTELQQKLFDIEKANSNMMAGYPIQMKAIEDYKKLVDKYDYVNACKYLESINLLYVDKQANAEERLYVGKDHSVNMHGDYKYGSSWLHYALEEDIEEQLEDLIEEIEQADSERVNKKDWDDLQKYKEELEDLIDDEKKQPLGIFLKLSPYEANEDIIVSSYDDCMYEYGKKE
jgi:hypothetical protein